MATILMTGVTGTVGSVLAPALKRAGHRLIFVLRAGSREEAGRRLRSLMELDERDILLPGNVVHPCCGLGSEAEVSRLRGGVDKVLHCAASITFDPNLDDEVHRTNVTGTQHVLQLADALNVPEFHHVSTLYVAGDADELREEDLDVGQSFRNAYERSKFEAELLVRSWSGRHSIYRLGIVVGDSGSGRTASFNGFYRVFSGFRELYNSLASRWRQDRTDCLERGISFDDEGYCHLPVRIQVSASSRLSLTPVDWAVEALAGHLEERAANRTYHLSPCNPPSIRWIAEGSFHALKLKDCILTEESPEPRHDFIGRIERKIQRDCRLYLPYMMHEAEFHRNPGSGPRRDFSRELFTNILDYAKQVQFGKTFGGDRR